MINILDAIQLEKFNWFHEPRYAAVTWPSLLLTISLGLGFATLSFTLFFILIISFLRLTKYKLLPYEKNRLNQVHELMKSLKAEEAIQLLNKPLRLSGFHYEVQKRVLLARSFMCEGNFKAAHQSLKNVRKRHLQKDEMKYLTIAWAELFLRSGNINEANRRLLSLDSAKCETNLTYLLIKAEVAIEQANYRLARYLLNTGLDIQPNDVQKVYLYNNLARLELFEGNSHANLQNLLAAMDIYNQAPRLDLINILHYNLAIAWVNQGEIDKAKQVLRDSFSLCDKMDVRQIIIVLNNSLEAAREAGDSTWVKEVYEEFERQLKRLPPLTEQQKLALDVSSLRMHRSDGLGKSSSKYLQFIFQLTSQLEKLKNTISTHEYVALLVELRGDLKYELGMPAKYGEDEFARLNSALLHTGSLLIECESFIRTNLRHYSPKLFKPLDEWHSFYLELSKARIERVEGFLECVPDEFLEHFSYLEERARALESEERLIEAIDAWFIVCDDFIAYYEQSPSAGEAELLNKSFCNLALKALEKAERCLQNLGNYYENLHQIVGIAYYALRLRSDTAKAGYWMKIEQWSNLVYRAKQRLLLMFPPPVCHLGISRC